IAINEEKTVTTPLSEEVVARLAQFDAAYKAAIEAGTARSPWNARRCRSDWDAAAASRAPSR
ncbi:MAG: hypothetical protein AAF449_02805, partial [Myxococcota bacterium]